MSEVERLRQESDAAWLRCNDARASLHYAATRLRREQPKTWQAVRDYLDAEVASADADLAAWVKACAAADAAERAAEQERRQPRLL